MIANELLQTVKKVSITAYLQTMGVLPAQKLTGKNQYVYCSPLSNETTPSFFVNEVQNVFNDYSTDERGDVIRLVQLLERIPFGPAVRRLQAFVGTIEPLSVTESLLPAIDPQTADIRITDVRTLQSPALLDYVQNERRIPASYAHSWLRQIHYTRNGKRFYGAGFRTDVGSWAVRNAKFKTWIGPTAITTIGLAGASQVNLFEGFFDYLSALVYYGKPQTQNTNIILNSVTNLNKALPALQAAAGVHCYLDNDPAGDRAKERLLQNGCTIIDRSGIYAGHNDFNAYLCSL